MQIGNVCFSVPFTFFHTQTNTQITQVVLLTICPAQSHNSAILSGPRLNLSQFIYDEIYAPPPPYG